MLFTCLFGCRLHFGLFVSPPQTDGLCSSDGVIIQTVTSDPNTSDPLDQTQLVVEAEGRSQEEQLEATSLLEGAESIVTETRGPMADGYSDKVGTRLCFESEKVEFSCCL